MSEIIKTWSLRDDDGMFPHVVFDKLEDLLEHLKEEAEDLRTGSEFEVTIGARDMERSQYDQMKELR